MMRGPEPSGLLGLTMEGAASGTARGSSAPESAAGSSPGAFVGAGSVFGGSTSFAGSTRSVVMSAASSRDWNVGAEIRAIDEGVVPCPGPVGGDDGAFEAPVEGEPIVIDAVVIGDDEGAGAERAGTLTVAALGPAAATPAGLVDVRATTTAPWTTEEVPAAEAVVEVPAVVGLVFTPMSASHPIGVFPARRTLGRGQAAGRVAGKGGDGAMVSYLDCCDSGLIVLAGGVSAAPSHGPPFQGADLKSGDDASR